MSARKARALVSHERACRRAPALGEAWHAGILTVSQAQALVPLVLTEGSEPFHTGWIARAGEVTVRRLEDDVEHALALGALDPPELPEPSDLAGPAGVQIGAEHTRPETDVWVANVPADVARLFRACLSTRFERRAGAVVQRNLHAHHVLFCSAGGDDDLANLTTLCAAHHQRCVHGGLIRISGRCLLRPTERPGHSRQAVTTERMFGQPGTQPPRLYGLTSNPESSRLTLEERPR
jgi:hypothetical protein